MEQFTLKFTFLYKYLWWSKFINWYQIDMLWLLFWLMIILCSFSNHEFRSSSFLINYWNQTSAWKRKGPLGLKNWILFSSTVGEILQFLCSFPNLVLKFKIHFQPTISKIVWGGHLPSRCASDLVVGSQDCLCFFILNS